MRASVGNVIRKNELEKKDIYGGGGIHSILSLLTIYSRSDFLSCPSKSKKKSVSYQLRGVEWKK